MMKMICPHCGLKGTAKETLLGKKVRCPECQKVFRVTEDVALVSPPVVSEQAETPDVALQQPVEEEAVLQDTTLLDSEDEETEDLIEEIEEIEEIEDELEAESDDDPIELVEEEVVETDEPDDVVEIELAEGVQLCSKCGFALSEKYLQETDSEPVCVLCAG